MPWRLPSHGRDVALGIRKFKSTRYVPLVFVEGDPEKVKHIKELLPDAVYTTWSQIQGALKRAIAHPTKDPVVPRTALDGYSGTPLPKKLGIKAHSVVCLIDAPKSFENPLRLVSDCGASCGACFWSSLQPPPFKINPSLSFLIFFSVFTYLLIRVFMIASSEEKAVAVLVAG